MKQKILIVGSSGQLGGKVYDLLVQQNQFEVYAFVRKDSKIDHLQLPESNKFVGDLLDPVSLENALKEMDIVISTANSSIPRKKDDTVHNVDYLGNKNLVNAAESNGIKQLIFVSVSGLEDKSLKKVPLAAAKIKAEEYLKKSKLNYTIIRPTVFMDVYLTFMGTEIPMYGEKAHPVNRPWKFMNNFFRGVKNNIENGKIGIIGSGTVKQNYVAVNDVANYIVGSIGQDDFIGKTLEVAGPENLNALEVKSVFEEVLGKQLEVKRTPAFIMKALGTIYSLFNKEISNIFWLNYANSKKSMIANSKELAERLGIKQTYLKGFLESKIKK